VKSMTTDNHGCGENFVQAQKKASFISRTEAEQWIPEDGTHFDVIVAGGGPAGIGAALASAHKGAKTLLLEAKGFFGGVAATSLWMPMNRMRLNGGSRGGVHNLIIKKLEQYGADAYLEGKTSWVDGDGLHIHPEYLRGAIFELLEESGCHYRLYSPIVGAKTENGVLKAAVVQTKSGLAEFEANVFVDCTGDGDLSFFAGAETRTGREGDGSLMPITLGFALANVDTARLFEFYNGPDCGPVLRRILEEAAAEGFSCADWYSFDRTTIPGVASVNHGGLKGIGILDATKARDHTIAERTGITLALDFVKIARTKGIPGLEQCHLMRVGGNVGVRETRRVIGKYVLTIEDAIHGTEFPDVIARRYGAVDVAGLQEDKDYKQLMKSGYAYPYRGLLPVGVERLLVAGRCGSYTHLGMAAGKSMGNMIALGQAAGIAAAFSSQLGVTPGVLDPKVVQDFLVQWGVTL